MSGCFKSPRSLLLPFRSLRCHFPHHISSSSSSSSALVYVLSPWGGGGPCVRCHFGQTPSERVGENEFDTSFRACVRREGSKCEQGTIGAVWAEEAASCCSSFPKHLLNRTVVRFVLCSALTLLSLRFGGSILWAHRHERKTDSLHPYLPQGSIHSGGEVFPPPPKEGSLFLLKCLSSPKERTMTMWS